MWAISTQIEIYRAFIPPVSHWEKCGKISKCCRNCSQGSYSYFTFPLKCYNGMASRIIILVNQIWYAWLSWAHGTPRRTEIQKKMPYFGTHIFWLGIPQGSQKYPHENIPCVSKRKILIFLIYVLKNGPKLGWKEAYLALKCSWYFFVQIDCKTHTLFCFFRFMFSRYI